MTPREAIINQIQHHETTPIPHYLSMEQEIQQKVTAYYGSDSWKKKISPYIKMGCGIPTMAKEPIDNVRERDYFGSIWRIDKRPFHLEKPGMDRPSFEGYDFPSADRYVVPDLKEKFEKAKSEFPDSYTFIGLGWGLWENCWGIRGFENAMMDCISEPDFFNEILDKLTDLFLSHIKQCEGI